MLRVIDGGKEDSSQKFCKDCKFFAEIPSEIRFHPYAIINDLSDSCYSPINGIDPVSGSALRRNARDSRKKGPCGESAKGFEERPEEVIVSKKSWWRFWR